MITAHGKRRFIPGPAGHSSPTQQPQEHTAQKRKADNMLEVSKSTLKLIKKSKSLKRAEEYLSKSIIDPGSDLATVEDIRKEGKSYKVSKMMLLLIKDISLQFNSCTLTDLKGGEISASLHKSIVERIGTENLCVGGAFLMLKNVSVFRPDLRSAHLILSFDHLLQFFPADGSSFLLDAPLVAPVQKDEQDLMNFPTDEDLAPRHDQDPLETNNEGLQELLAGLDDFNNVECF